MLKITKNKINRELSRFLKRIDSKYSLNVISPLLAKSIKEFALRDGKRIRPILFIVGYLGFAKKAALNLYTSALAIELAHDFMLIHDDIIDKSELRRGKPSMHAMLNRNLSNYSDIKFSGQDLAIVAGDIIYAIAIEAFLSVKEKPSRKEKALQKFIETIAFTGCGQFLEILSGVKDISQITKHDIYKIYDLKTARYTFASPLLIGATLAGASQIQISKLFDYGMCLGRAFQIKDDVLGTFGDEKKIGKSNISDLKEAKKTLLLWHAYNKTSRKNKALIKKILSKKNINAADIKTITNIMRVAASLKYAKNEISKLYKKSQDILKSCKIRKKEKIFLSSFSAKILSL